MTGRRGLRSWNWDSALGGERVADKVPGLTIESSRLDGKIDAAGLTSYAEWTFVFKNIALTPSEARAQIQLPPGGVVSRLTLWIEGEPREAAFGSRAQVRAAYQEVAVQQKRDPVLVTTSGPDRVLMQCFPVPPNGGEMKVRVGITAPLRVLDETRAALLLPRILENNYDPRNAFAHDVWIENPQTWRQRLSDVDFQQPRAVPVSRASAADQVWTDDPGDPAFVIRQTVQAQTTARPTHLAVVLDGSQAMRAPWQSIIATLASRIDGARSLPVSVHFAGDRHETWSSGERVAAWLAPRRPGGGCDNLPALLDAWDSAARAPGGVIIWIRGPQPVALTPASALHQRIDRDQNQPLIYDLPVANGPNRLLEESAAFPGWRRGDLETSPQQSLERLLAHLLDGAPRFAMHRERLPKDEALLATSKTDRHLARLWGAEEVARLRGAPATLDQAVKLALQLQLVTPVSGAVVLERKEQYDRHGLTPVPTDSVPSVPEPTTALLIAGGVLALSLRRRR